MKKQELTVIPFPSPQETFSHKMLHLGMVQTNFQRTKKLKISPCKFKNTIFQLLMK